MTEKEEQGWRKEERRIFWKEWAYVPDLATLQERIIWDHYDYEPAGHLGYTKTQKHINLSHGTIGVSAQLLILRNMY